MKTIVTSILAVALLLVVYSSVGLAAQSETAISSGILNSSAVVTAKPARLTDIAVYTDGANNATVTVYDNASAASGTVLYKVVVTGTSLNGGAYIPIPVQAINGIYCSISGTGASAIVYYSIQ